MKFYLYLTVLILFVWQVCDGEEDAWQTHLKLTADIGHMKFEKNYKSVWEAWNEPKPSFQIQDSRFVYSDKRLTKPKSERQMLIEEKTKLLKSENERMVLDNNERTRWIKYKSEASEVDSNVGTREVGGIIFLLWLILLLGLLRCYCRKNYSSRTGTWSSDKLPDFILNQSPHISGLHPPDGSSSQNLPEPFRKQILQPSTLPHGSIPNNIMKVGELPSYNECVSYECPTAPPLEDDEELPPYSAVEMQRN